MVLALTENTRVALPAIIMFSSSTVEELHPYRIRDNIRFHIHTTGHRHHEMAAVIYRRRRPVTTPHPSRDVHASCFTNL